MMESISDFQDLGGRRPPAYLLAAQAISEGEMAGSGMVDRELSELIEEIIDAELLAPASRELEIARLVAAKGQGALDLRDRHIFETRLLPILSKPIDGQIAIASIVRRGGFVPRKIQT